MSTSGDVRKEELIRSHCKTSLVAQGGIEMGCRFKLSGMAGKGVINDIHKGNFLKGFMGGVLPGTSGS